MNGSLEEQKASQILVFFVNGRKILDENPDPKETLLNYLRRKLILTGTKLGCGEGGCGACTVMVSQFNRQSGRICHHSVNACITPLVSVHGRAVTTVEGIGRVGEDGSGLHPVQERIAKSHGSQCGFCTPGIVMSMYALLRNNPSPTEEQIENAFQGNLCRCTGYRPILDGFKTFAGSKCCGGMKDGKCCMSNGDGSVQETPAMKLFDEETFRPYDATQEVIFPSELQTNDSYDTTPLHFSSSSQSWFRPVSLQQLLKLKKEHPSAKLVVGNTELGVEANVRKIHYPTLISCANVSELRELKASSSGVVIGASATLSDICEFLQSLKKTELEFRLRPFAAILDMLHWFAGSQIRNVASIGGNVMTASPISDLNPLLAAADAVLVFKRADSQWRRRKMDQSFFKAYRRVDVAPDEVLVAVEIPFTDETSHVLGFKQAHRREDDISIVNAGIRVKFSSEAEDAVVEEFCAAFGGVAPVTKLAEKSARIAIGRCWDEALLEEMLQSLSKEFVLEFGTPGGSELYRCGLVLSFFFRFFWTVANERSGRSEQPSALGMVPRGLSQGSQLFDGVPEDQGVHDPVGRPLVHLSGLKQATGEAVYVDDMPTFAHELFLAPVMSQRAHARLLGVDTSAALAVDGVRGWVDHRDIPGENRISEDEEDGVVFPEGEVVFHGQIIGAVVAVTREIAQLAAQKVVVTYEDQPAVITAEDAVAAGTFFSHFHMPRGDVTQGFADSAAVVEGEVRLGGQEHFYLETHANLAVPKEGGEMDVYSSSQYPQSLQATIAGVLGIPRSLTTVRIRRLGGGFGGKETQVSAVAAPVAVAARKFGVPVRWMLDRCEDMILTGKRHPCLIRYKLGATKEGDFKALDLKAYFNAGHSKDLSVNVAMVGVLQGNLGYRFPNINLEAYSCRTNIASNTAFRGFGHPQVRYGLESCIAQLSDALGVSVEELRRRNLNRTGDELIFGTKLEACNIVPCYESVTKLSQWEKRREEVDLFNRDSRWKKRGIALMPMMYGCSYEAPFLNQGYALVNIYLDGSVLLSHGGVEMGQGLHTKMIQVASRSLGIGVEWIHTTDVSTDKTPNTSSTAASFSTDLNGRAVMAACEKIRRRLAPIEKTKPDLAWPDLVKAAYMDGISLSATGYHHDDTANFDKETLTGCPYIYYAYGASCTEVEVDCLTGDHVIRRVDIVIDVGKSLNPAIDIGQIEGAFVQGCGMFTMEELRMSPKGEYFTNGPGNYKIPGFGDIPEVLNVHLLRDTANPHPRSVFSSKAVGEPPLLLSVGVPMALRAAISAARKDAGLSGFFRLDSPVTAERIRVACEDEILQLVKETMPRDSGKRWDIQQ